MWYETYRVSYAGGLCSWYVTSETLVIVGRWSNAPAINAMGTSRGTLLWFFMYNYFHARWS